MLSIIQGPAADAATPTAAPTGKAELVTPSATKPAAGLVVVWFYCVIQSQRLSHVLGAGT